MLDINLLPEEQRIKKSDDNPWAIYVIYGVVLVIAVVLLVHLYLGIVYGYRASSFYAYNKKWQGLEPQRRKIAETIKNDADPALNLNKTSKELENSRILQSYKLNKLSAYLPAGIWFNDLSINRKEMVIKASVVSLKKDEMQMINDFIDGLKNDKDFNKDFSSIEMGAVQRRSIASFEVMDFVVTASFK